MNQKQEQDELPRDVNSIDKIIKSMGIDKYDPCVSEQLIEFIYRYVSEILQDSQTFSEHKEKTEIEVEDIKLAIQCKLNYSFTEPPSVEFLSELSKNNIPIMIPEKSCVLLPPKENCLQNEKK